MKTVLCNGVFDLLHVAHVRHLRQAAQWGDRLIVAVTDDANANKGDGRPIIPLAERIEMIKALPFVSDAVVCRDSLEALKRWKPDVFCKGHDYVKKGLLDAEIEYCKVHGIRIAITDENPQTTSGIIERIRQCGLSITK